jgi:hypothetical protein
MGNREIFIRDFILIHNFIGNVNFEAGVRSLLITKDNNPQWTHGKLLDVAPEEVDVMFILQPGKKPL